MIAQQVRQFVMQNYLLGQETTFEDSDSFLEQGIIDSTAVLELVAFIEENFGFTVEDEDLVPDNLDSVNNVTGYISRKRGLCEQQAVSIVTERVA